MIAFVTTLDTQVLQYLFAHRTITTTISFIDISELGSTIFVCGIALCVGILLMYRRKVLSATALALSVLGSGAVALVIKEITHRARPDAAYQAYLETGFSFPSAHATLAAALYGFLIYLAYRMMPSGYPRTVVVFVCGLLIILISFSRLYIGVHYLSDVIGGLLLGGIFVWAASLLVRKFEQ